MSASTGPQSEPRPQAGLATQAAQAPPERIAGRHPDDDWELAEPYPMGPATLSAFRAQLRALCPSAPAPWSAELSSKVERSARVSLSYLPPLLGLGFLLAIHLLDWSPIWRLRAARRLQNLERDRASQLLQQLGDSRFKPFRLLIMGSRAIVLSTYYDQEEVHQALDYDPLPFLQERNELRRRLLEGGDSQEDDLIGPYSEVLR